MLDALAPLDVRAAAGQRLVHPTDGVLQVRDTTLEVRPLVASQLLPATGALQELSDLLPA